jgi:GAF domain-containing protein
MHRGPKPAKSKAKPPVARKSPKNEDARVLELEKRLAEALEQKAAASEILRVISQSPTDVQPVFDAIAESAVRLCDAEAATVTRFDGEWVHIGAIYGLSAARSDALRGTFPMRPSGAGGAARAIRDRAIVHIPDVVSDQEYEIQQTAMRSGYRGLLAVPMLHKGHAIGAITLGRAEPGEFSDTQVQLLRTFADQAVIAIENVRLFTELQTSNRELTTSLDRQTATSDILRVISRSQTDVQPVFDTIIKSAVTLCDGLFGSLDRFDGDLIFPVATHNYTPEALDAVHRMFPARPNRSLGVGRAIVDRDVVHIPDVELDPEYTAQALAGTIGFRSGLFVPMLRDGIPIGVILVGRAEPGPFSDNQIELLKTFADQAVIAIENVRLFKGWCPRSCGKSNGILPVDEVHDQPAALAGGHWGNAPWARVSGKLRKHWSLSPSL